MTREGVMYYKFSNKMTPEHNVKLACTRMLAGPMDLYTGWLPQRHQQAA